MGKVLIISGADFSNNALAKVTPIDGDWVVNRNEVVSDFAITLDTVSYVTLVDLLNTQLIGRQIYKIRIYIDYEHTSIELLTTTTYKIVKYNGSTVTVLNEFNFTTNDKERGFKDITIPLTSLSDNSEYFGLSSDVTTMTYACAAKSSTDNKMAYINSSGEVTIRLGYELKWSYFGI